MCAYVRKFSSLFSVAVAIVVVVTASFLLVLSLYFQFSIYFKFIFWHILILLLTSWTSLLCHLVLLVSFARRSKWYGAKFSANTHTYTHTAWRPAIRKHRLRFSADQKEPMRFSKSFEYYSVFAVQICNRASLLLSTACISSRSRRHDALSITLLFTRKHIALYSFRNSSSATSYKLRIQYLQPNEWPCKVAQEKWEDIKKLRNKINFNDRKVLISWNRKTRNQLRTFDGNKWTTKEKKDRIY